MAVRAGMMGLALLWLCGAVWAQVTPEQAERIRQAAPAAARVKPKRPRTVLLWNTPPSLMDKDPHKGYCIPYGERAIQALGEKTGAFRVVVSGDIGMYRPEKLKQFDAIVMNNSSGPWIRPTEADMARLWPGQDVDVVERMLRKSLVDYVAGGGGLVAFHYAIGANPQWPEFQALLGAKFTGHPWNEEVGIHVEEPDHPLLKAFGGKSFRLADEIYEFGPPYSRGKLRVLLSLDTKATNMGVPWITRKDGDFAQAWVRTEGKGRVFYGGFGHRTEVWWNPTVLAFYLDAIQFACGDLAAPTAPRAAASAMPAPGQQPPAGFRALFDGRTLDGWEGDRRIWSVEEGAIVGRTSADSPLRENNFLVWREPVEDFVLRLKFRLEGGNSGIYFRAKKRAADSSEGDPLIGMQADFDATGRWTGVVMEYALRDVLAERGERVTIDADGKRSVAGSVGDPQELLQAVKSDDWNDYEVTARGGHIVLKINGKTMCDLEDRDPRRLRRGAPALQTHVGAPMVVRFRDIYLSTL